MLHWSVRVPRSRTCLLYDVTQRKGGGTWDRIQSLLDETLIRLRSDTYSIDRLYGNTMLETIDILTNDLIHSGLKLNNEEWKKITSGAMRVFRKTNNESIRKGNEYNGRRTCVKSVWASTLITFPFFLPPPAAVNGNEIFTLNVIVVGGVHLCAAILHDTLKLNFNIVFFTLNDSLGFVIQRVLNAIAARSRLKRMFLQGVAGTRGRMDVLKKILIEFQTYRWGLLRKFLLVRN